MLNLRYVHLRSSFFPSHDFQILKFGFAYIASRLLQVGDVPNMLVVWRANV